MDLAIRLITGAEEFGARRNPQPVLETLWPGPAAALSVNLNVFMFDFLALAMPGASQTRHKRFAEIDNLRTLIAKTARSIGT